MGSHGGVRKRLRSANDVGRDGIRRVDLRVAYPENTRGLVSRVVHGVSVRFWRRLDQALFFLVKHGASWLSTEKIAILKDSLKPITRLDYPHDQILMGANSPLHVGRAFACRKEPETVDWIENEIEPGDVLYDVGANVGAYSILASRLSRCEATVHAFEPSFSTYFDLCNNILLNGCQKSVFPHLMALASTSGTSIFNYSSLNSGASVHSLGDCVDQRGESFEPEYQQSVMCYSVDDLVRVHGFPIPNLVKIDVDGIELEILKGSERTLEDPRLRSILVEVFEPGRQCQAVVELITAKGFELRVRAPHLNGVANYVFARGE